MDRSTGLLTRRHLLIAGWVLVLGLSALIPLSAFFHGAVHIGRAPFVAQGVQRSPLVAIDSDVYLPYGSRSTVVTLFGSIHVRRQAGDDLVAVGGNIYLHRGSIVRKDAVTIVGSTYRARDVTVDGRLGGALHSWDNRTPQRHPTWQWAITNNIRLGLAAGLALLLVGTCLTIVFPWQVVLIASTLKTSPLKSTAAGLMNLLIFVFLVVPLGLSLAGLPFAILLTAAASFAWLFGFTAAAVVLGQAVARGPASLLWATAAGLVIFALGMALPLLGPLLVVGVGLTGAGALAVALVGRARPTHPLPETFSS